MTKKSRLDKPIRRHLRVACHDGAGVPGQLRSWAVFRIAVEDPEDGGARSLAFIATNTNRTNRAYDPNWNRTFKAT